MKKNGSGTGKLFYSVLDAQFGGRPQILQALIRHFLVLLGPSFASILNEQDVDFAYCMKEASQLPHLPPPMRVIGDRKGEQAYAMNAILDRLVRFNGLSQLEQESLLEDCAVLLFGMMCDNGKKTVLVENAREIYNFCGADIVEQLRGSGFNAWAVLTNNFEANEQQLPIDKPLLEKMDYVALILSAPYGIKLDSNHCTKTFGLSFSPAMNAGTFYSALEKDFFYVPNHSITDDLFRRYKNACPLPPDLVGPRRKFTAIPVGNVKMLRMREIRQKILPEKRNKILFCSNALDMPDSIVKEYGITLIRRILDRFPDNILVYRPHPAWFSHPTTIKLRESFASEARFVFDTNMLSEEMIASGCALITDGSLSGLTYSLASSRPSIYINPLITIFSPRILNIKFEDGIFFRFCWSIDEVLGAMVDLVSNPAKEYDEITELADSIFAHPHDSWQYLLSSIKAIVENKILPDWKSLEISEEDVGDESAGSYVGVIRNSIAPFYSWPLVINADIRNFPQDVKTTIINACKHDHKGHLHFSINLFKWALNNFRKYGFCQFTGEVASGSMRLIFKRGNANEVAAMITSLRDVAVEIIGDPRRTGEAHSLLSWFRTCLSDEIRLNPEKCSERFLKHWLSLKEGAICDKPMIVFDLADALLIPTTEMGHASGADAIDKSEEARVLIAQELITLCCAPPLSSSHMPRVQLRANLVPLLSQTLGLPYFPSLNAAVRVGSSSRGIAFDGANLWVANNASYSVSKINPIAAQVIKSITCGPGPHSMAFDGAYMWLTNSGTNTVEKIDVDTDTIVGCVTVGKTPTGIAFDGTYMWVANNASNTLSKIDVAKDTVVATVAVSKDPYGVCFDGTHIWNTTYNVGENTLRTSVDKVDIVTNAKVATIAVDKQPHCLAFDGDHIWAGNLTSRSVSKIDALTNMVVATVALGDKPTAIAFDGKHIWVAMCSSGVSKIDIDLNAIVQDITIINPFIRGMAFDGRYIWFGNNSDNVVHRIPV